MIFSRPRPGHPPVVLVRPATEPDDYGEGLDRVWDERATRAPLPGAWVQHRDSVDAPTDGRPARIRTTAVLYAPGDPGVEEGDRIEVGGEAWEIDGAVAVHRGLGARPVYTSATLRRVTG